MNSTYNTNKTALYKWAQKNATLRTRIAIEYHGAFTGDTRGCGYCAQGKCVFFCEVLKNLEFDLSSLHYSSWEAWKTYQDSRGATKLIWPTRPQIKKDIDEDKRIHIFEVEAIIRRGNLFATGIGWSLYSDIQELNCFDHVEKCGEWDWYKPRTDSTKEILEKVSGIPHRVRNVKELVRRYYLGYDRERERKLKNNWRWR